MLTQGEPVYLRGTCENDGSVWTSLVIPGAHPRVPPDGFHQMCASCGQPVRLEFVTCEVDGCENVAGYRRPVDMLVCDRHRA